MRTFSLWTEQWIPVQPLVGPPKKVSLRDALVHAHTYRGVQDSSPLVTVALHRLLLALLYRTHSLATQAEWRSLWSQRQLDQSGIDRYGDPAWFDLLHPERPFYQVPYLPDEKEHPIAALLVEASSGNNPALFDHGLVEGADSLPLDRAACYLLAHQLFAIGGGVSKPFNRMDAPLTKGMVVEAVGPTLFATLMLNALPLDRWERLTPATAHDRPFWEEERPAEPLREGTLVQGPLHYLTWQSRQLHLIVDQDHGVVTGCQIRQRYCLPKDGNRVDPGKAYYESKEEGFQPRRLQKDRAAWRMAHVLLQEGAEKEFRPAVVAWLRDVQGMTAAGRIELPAEAHLAVSGLTTDPKLAAKVELWRREELGFPSALLADPDMINDLEKILQDAEDVERLLRRTGEALIWTLAERKHQSEAIRYLYTGKSAVKMPPTVAPVAQSLGLTLRFWSALEGPFRRLLWHLPERERSAVEHAWQSELTALAADAVESVWTTQQRAGVAWEPLTLIRDAFSRRLRRLFSSEGEGTQSDSE